MGITIHYSGTTDEKTLDASTKYWSKTIPKLQNPDIPQLLPGFEIMKRWTKIRDAGPEEKDILNRKVGFTEEDMFNHIYTGPTMVRHSNFIDEGTPNEQEINVRWEPTGPPKWQRTDHCKGIRIDAFDGCEWVHLTGCNQPDGKWAIQGFTKTQFCGIPGHLTVCKVLKEAKQKFFHDMKISDEGGYCGDDDDGNINKLRENMEGNAILIDQIGEQLSSAGWGDNIVTGGERALKKSREVV